MLPWNLTSVGLAQKHNMGCLHLLWRLLTQTSEARSTRLWNASSERPHQDGSSTGTGLMHQHAWRLLADSSDSLGYATLALNGLARTAQAQHWLCQHATLAGEELP
jgi:hypothetical protein